MVRQFSLLLVLALAIGCLGQTKFMADIEIYDDPNIAGVLVGKMFYDQSVQKIRINYDFGLNPNPVEIVDYNNVQNGQVRYLGCGNPTSCQAESYKQPFPIYYKQNGETPSSQTWGCGAGQDYVRSVSGPKQVKGLSLTAGGVLCKALLQDGTSILFKNVDTATAFPADIFSVVSGWNCPAKQCNQKIDLALVLDQSGSVAGDWPTEKKFAVDFASSFTISEQATKFGCVTFSDSAVQEFGLLNDKASVVNKLNGLSLRGGSTCIGCGLVSGKNLLNNQGRAGVQKLIVLLTDGQNNRGSGTTDINNAIPFAKQGGTWVFVIGVTTAIDEAQLKSAASGTNGYMTVAGNPNPIQTYFPAVDWSKLNGIIYSLVAATCQDLPGNPCGTGCIGFCSCGKTCICPSKCDARSKCETGKCTANLNGNGCAYTPISCDDNDKCTADTCDPATGCKHTAITCLPKPCYTVACDKSLGCVYTPISCDDGDICTADSCNANGVCQHPLIPCDVCKAKNLDKAKCQAGQNPCEIWDCVQTGSNAACTKTGDKVCDDLNSCTADTCDSKTGNCVFTPITCDDKDACTTDSCDPAKGCVYTAINATSVCNDFSACTTDFCDKNKGCVNEPIPCKTGNPCKPGACNSLLGCEAPTVDCTTYKDFGAKIGTCFAALCNDLKSNLSFTIPAGCYLQQQPNTNVDRCGVCLGDGNSCFLGIGLEKAAAIGAGAVAGIVIGAVAIVGAVSAIGAKKGWDAYQRNKKNMAGANTSPLYKDPGNSGNNPFYSGGK